MIPRPSEGFFSSRDGLHLKYAVWFSGPDCPWFVIAHGYGEHLGRYETFARAILEKKDINIAMQEMRGFGHSQGVSGYVRDFSEYGADFEDFTGMLKDRYACQSPIAYLFAHSMGSLVAVRHVLNHPEHFRKLLLSSPCFLPVAALPFSELLVFGLAKLFPKYQIPKPVSPKFLTHSEAEREKYARDSLIPKRISLNLVAGMIKEGREMVEKASTIDIPTCIFMGEGEKVVDKKMIERFYANLTVKEKRWYHFPGLYHELFREASPEDYFSRLFEAMEENWF